MAQLVTHRGTEATAMEDLEVRPKTVLAQSGYSATLAYDPTTRAVHVAWVEDRRLRYARRDHDGRISTAETIHTGVPVHGQEGEGDDAFARSCVGLTADNSGIVHFLFADPKGAVYHLSGRSDEWGEPVRLVENDDTTINPGIVSLGADLHAIYESGNKNQLYYVSRIGGTWSRPAHLDKGKYAVIAQSGHAGGTVYFCWRANFDLAGPRSAGFAYWTPATMDRPRLVEQTTDATRRLGAGPGLAVGGGMLYLAWCNSSGVNGKFKAQCYLASAPEPGLEWHPRVGLPDMRTISRDERHKIMLDLHKTEGEERVLAPAERLGAIYYEDTGDPHSRAAVFGDGTVLYLHGKSTPRVALWNGEKWSATRPAPWSKGTIQVDTDGRSVWVVASSSRVANDEVSLTEIVNPGIA